MRQDMNFFVQFNSKKRKNDGSTIILAVLVSVVVAAMVISFGYNTISIYLNNKEADDYKAKVEAPEMQAKIKESREINEKIDWLTKYDNDAAEVNNAIESRNIVNVMLLNKVSSTIPTEISFAYTNFSNSSIVIQAATTNRKSIAEIEHNLRELKDKYNKNYFADVNVESIAGEGPFATQITCYFAGGDSNEN